ncbi:MAG TPA: CzcE family metal-binding protein [Burkholderiales bacterium]
MKMLKAVAVLALSAASLSAVAMTNADRYGEAASPVAADRTSVISPNSRFVNVNHGEVVKFVANGQEFAWDFDGLPQSFDLKQVAPQGALAQNVKVYIALTDQDISIGD